MCDELELYQKAYIVSGLENWTLNGDKMFAKIKYTNNKENSYKLKHE